MKASSMYKKAFKRSKDGRLVPRGINGNTFILKKQAEKRQDNRIMTLATWCLIFFGIIIAEIL